MWEKIFGEGVDVFGGGLFFGKFLIQFFSCFDPPPKNICLKYIIWEGVKKIFNFCCQFPTHPFDQFEFEKK